MINDDQSAEQVDVNLLANDIMQYSARPATCISPDFSLYKETCLLFDYPALSDRLLLSFDQSPS
jgi:hypothetical protein